MRCDTMSYTVHPGVCPTGRDTLSVALLVAFGSITFGHRRRHVASVTSDASMLRSSLPTAVPVFVCGRSSAGGGGDSSAALRHLAALR